VLENWVLRRIFEPKRDEMTRRRKLHNEEVHNLYSSPSTIRIFKSKRMRLAWNVARMDRGVMYIRYWWENQKERDH
jgi:hypothetical protein